MINITNNNDPKGYEIENIEKQKQEYKLIGTFMRNKSLKLFSYNHLKEELTLVDESRGDELELVMIDGKLKPNYNISTESTVNTNNTHFEAMNMRTAKKRVDKFKKGLIKDLDNLRKYDPKPIYPFGTK